MPHSSRVGSQITGCSNLYPLNASQSVSKIRLLVFTVCPVSLLTSTGSGPAAVESAAASVVALTCGVCVVGGFRWL